MKLPSKKSSNLLLARKEEMMAMQDLILPLEKKKGERFDLGPTPFSNIHRKRGEREGEKEREREPERKIE